jgi:hypothetical protein
MKRIGIPAWVIWALLVLSVVFYSFSLRSWGNFIYRPGGLVSDLTITYWPNIHYIHQTLAEYGQYPLWRTSILSGSPFDVDPQSGLWYLPNLLFFFLPEAQGFNLLFLLHSLLGGIGMWYWSKSTGTSDQGAFLAVLAYAFAPRAFAHLGFGHVGLFYSAAYIPWVLWAAGHLARGKWRYSGVIGLALGMQMITHLQLAIYTGAAAGLYVLFHEWSAVRDLDWRGKFGQIIPALAGFPLALAVASVLLIPLLRFAPYSGRAQMTGGDPAASALPVRYLLGLILADHTGFADFMIYVGPPLLALSLLPLKRREARYWWLAIGLMTLYAVASGVESVRATLARVPILQWLRAPARIWFLAVAALALLGGWGYDRLKMIQSSVSGQALRRLLSFGATAFILLLLGGYWRLMGELPAYLIHFGISAIATVLILLLVLERRLAPSLFFLAFSAILLGDLWGLDFTLIEGRTPEWIFSGRPLAQELADRIGESPERVYSPGYSLPQQLAAQYGIETVNGVDPLYLAAYDDLMQMASGVSRQWYSGVVPAMEGGQPIEIVNLGAKPDLRLLGLLSARYVASEFPLQIQGLSSLGRSGGSYLYENSRSLPAAFIVGEAIPIQGVPNALLALENLDVSTTAVVEGGERLQSADLDWDVQWLSRTPNRLVLRAETSGRALLVISQAWYLDWVATIDGRRATTYRTDATLTGLTLDPGEHDIVLEYHPKTLIWGLFSSALAILVCALLILGIVRGGGGSSAQDTEFD